MPKLSKVEECLLCERVPCECSGKKTQAVRKRAPAIQPVDRAGGSSMRDKMKAAAAAAPPPRATISAQASRSRSPQGDMRTNQPPQLPSDPDPDTVLAVAIRNLAPLLHPEELSRYSMLVGSVPTAKQRAEFWRANREASDGTTQPPDPAVAQAASATQASNG